MPYLGHNAAKIFITQSLRFARIVGIEECIGGIAELSLTMAP